MSNESMDDSTIDSNKKRRAITMEMKVEIIKYHEKGYTAAEIARGYKMPHSTIRTIIIDKDRIMNHATQSISMQSTLISMKRGPIIEKMEQMLTSIIEERAQQQIPMSFMFIKENALRIFEDLKREHGDSVANTFTASHGWFQRFKKRANLYNVIITGEDAIADKAGATNFIKIIEMDSIEVSRVLIKEVEKYPILYDSGRPDYGNKSTKQDAWEAVCKALITTWGECSIYEKVNLKRDIQRRWQNIVKPFIKSLNPSSEGKKCNKQNIYHNDLQFIISTLNRPKAVPPIATPEEENNKMVNDSKKHISTKAVAKTYMQLLQPIRPKPFVTKGKLKRQRKKVSNAVSKNICLEDPLNSNTLKIEKKTVKNMALHPYEEVLIHEDNDSDDDPLQSLEGDPDRMFFLSLLPSFRKIPTEQKLTAQLEVMQTIMKYTVPSSDSSTPPISSLQMVVKNNKTSNKSREKNSSSSVKVELLESCVTYED